MPPLPTPSTVLNPGLYRRLVSVFGAVRVSNPGDEMIYRIRSGDQGRVDILASGEYYRIQCFACNDTRFRLWINHRYGTNMPGTTKPWTALAHCYNEQCMAEYRHRDRLYELVCTVLDARDRTRFALRQNVAPEAGRQLAPVAPPGVILPINTLSPSDPARHYLEQERTPGFDVDYLHEWFDVGLCVDADEQWPAMQGRIYIPIIMHGMLVGWQGRLVGKLPPGSSIPKYYGMPGMPKRLMLYNWDRARQSRLLLLVEGAPAVWAIGPGLTAALLGKTVTSHQLSLLRDWVRETNGAIILCLDPDAQDDSAGARTDLQRITDGRFANVLLPAGYDPADLEPTYFWERVFAAAAHAGLDIGHYAPELLEA